ncbi:MAG TPA: hypothetical protein VGH77_17805 [Streptosporangiaceae bacterium]
MLSSALLGTAARTTVPYTFFVRQVTADNVTQVTSTGNTIQGTFRHQVRYPPGTKNAQQVAEFSTERPTFANDHLFQQLQARGVTVTAKPPDQGAPLWKHLLLRFGPALLLGGLLWWFWRRSGMSALGGMGGMSRSRARRYDPGTGQRTTFAEVAASMRSRAKWPRSWTSCGTRAATAGWARRSRTACCSPASRAPARRCWPGRWPTRPTCRSSRSPPRSSSR